MRGRIRTSRGEKGPGTPTAKARFERRKSSGLRPGSACALPKWPETRWARQSVIRDARALYVLLKEKFVADRTEDFVGSSGRGGGCCPCSPGGGWRPVVGRWRAAAVAWVLQSRA